MNVAVYSGSFNPLHKGHEAIIRYLTAEGGFDIVYLVVTPQNPFKEKHSNPTGRQRYEAAVAAVEHCRLNCGAILSLGSVRGAWITCCLFTQTIR